jgi:hypothetical protein
MRYKIKFEENVLDSVNERIKYYEKISIKLADKFHQEFWSKIDYIKKHPLQHSIKYREIRIAHIKIFPIGIHFIIENDNILILKVLHHKQFYK